MLSKYVHIYIYKYGHTTGISRQFIIVELQYASQPDTPGLPHVPGELCDHWQEI